MTTLPLIAVEDALITKIAAIKRPQPSPPDPLPDHYVAPAPRAVFNKVDVYRGERDDVFNAIIRETAPSCWLRHVQAINDAKEFIGGMKTGQAFSMGTTQDRVPLTWSFLLGAQSLRAPKELTHGGPGVIGAYDLLNYLLTNLRGWAPVASAEPFQFMGWELLGQTTSAVVYDAHFRTRAQL